MSVSLEALAMAGIDSNERAMDAEEWERNEMEKNIPPHLLADEDNEEDEMSTKFPATRCSCCRKDEGVGGVSCSPTIMWHLRKITEKRDLNCLSSMEIVTSAVVGFLMFMTIKIIASKRSKS
ncbi:hypothetical protein SDJN03_05880, partial [Cucurbita argyrosperma subsp. sororia]